MGGGGRTCRVRAYRRGTNCIRRLVRACVRASGDRYDIVVELRVPVGADAHISLLWESFSQPRQVVPRYWLWPGSYPLSNSPYHITAL